MQNKAALEIKGSMISTLDIKIYTDVVGDIEAFLKQKFGKKASFFDGKTAILDLRLVPDLVDIEKLIDLIRQFGMIPIGLRHATSCQQDIAIKLHLASFEPKPEENEAESVLSDDTLEQPQSQASNHQTTKDEMQAVTQEVLPFDQITLLETQSQPVTEEDLICHRPAMILSKPLRSGQQYYAKNADLIVLAPVSFGAEVIADGNIHIYSTLRGRALAGVLGDRNARIYCLSMKAELVSIAGVYRTFENPLPDALTQTPVQILLNDADQLLVELIDRQANQ